MASARRERIFEENRKRKEKADTLFNLGTWLQILSFGGVYVALQLYYFIRGLALLAGAGMMFGQLILNYATGGNEKSALQFQKPYLFLFYLSAITILALITKLSKKKIFSNILSAVYIGAFAYGVISLFTGIMPVLQSSLFCAQAFLGFWCSDIVTRQIKEFKYLSLQEGYPDFIEAIGEPVPIANTSGIYLRQYEKMKEEARKNAVPYVEHKSAVNVDDHIIKNEDAMDEVITDFNEPIEELLKKTK